MPKQMVMSQTPLHTFQEFHNKWCLVSGPDHDGGAVQVAQRLVILLKRHKCGSFFNLLALILAF